MKPKQTDQVKADTVTPAAENPQYFQMAKGDGRTGSTTWVVPTILLILAVCVTAAAWLGMNI
jgi:hypothetical protein